MAAPDDLNRRRLSEFELIELFGDRPPDPGRIRVGIGDDAAVVDSPGRTVTSVDTAVEGIHFRREWSSPEQIAAKAINSALSDLAAMGTGESGADVFLTLGIPRDSENGLLRGIARAAVRTAAAHGAALAGGDTVSSPVLFLGVAVTAHAAGDEPLVTRAGARTGDLVAVTGCLGAARAGLWLLENPGLPVSPELPPQVRRSLIESQLEPWARVAAGAPLARAGATAMIDLSDGLLADLGHVARSSSAAGEAVSIRVDADLVPAATGAGEVATAAGMDRRLPVLQGGEDYELAVVLPPDRVSPAVQALAAQGLDLTVIGEVEPAGEAGGGVRTCIGGQPFGFPYRGFEHLA